MPFTLSHPAAVLPLVRADGTARGRLLASGLVAGSLAPDVPFYLPGLFRTGRFTHAAWAVPTVDVLIAAGLVGAWVLLRAPLVELVPPGLRGRAAAAVLPADGRGRPQGSRRERAGWFWASAALGAATHVGWDAFTHHGRAGVRLLPVLERVVAGQSLYTWAQYGSSAVGLAALGWFAARMLREAPAGSGGAGPAVAPEPPGLTGRRLRRAYAGIGAVSAVAGGCRCWSMARGGTAEHWYEWIPTALFAAGTGVAAGVVAYGVLARARGGLAAPAGKR